MNSLIQMIQKDVLHFILILKTCLYAAESISSTDAEDGSCTCTCHRTGTEILLWGACPSTSYSLSLQSQKCKTRIFYNFFPIAGQVCLVVPGAVVFCADKVPSIMCTFTCVVSPSPFKERLFTCGITRDSASSQP